MPLMSSVVCTSRDRSCSGTLSSITKSACPARTCDRRRVALGRRACAPDFPLKTWLFGDALTDGDYRSLAIVMIAIYPVGVPLMLFSVLYTKRKVLFEKLDPNAPVIRDSDGDIVRTPHHETSKFLGSLYVVYSCKFYWWEVVELCRKVLLTSIIIFIKPESSTQLAVGCLIALTLKKL